jgi:hypothetical protein
MVRAVHGDQRYRSAFTIWVKKKATQTFVTPGMTHPTKQHHTKDNQNFQQH